LFLITFFSNLFGFLSVLLIKKWFTEIILIYLPVGHTHEKVDGMLFAPHLRSLKRFKDFCTFRFTLNQEHDTVFMYKNSILEHTWIGFQGLVDG
jgi:hypothetical protein